jgi:hypothetical protein
MTERRNTAAIDQKIEETTEADVIPEWQRHFSTTPRNCRVLMFAPTSFFADYGCHVRILEEARVLRRLGHQVTIAAHHSGNLVPGLDIRRTLSIPWRRSYVVGSSRHKIVDMFRLVSTYDLNDKAVHRRELGIPPAS